MRTEKWLVLCIALLLIQLVACERGKMEENAPVPVSARTRADSAWQDSIASDSIRKDSIRKDTIRKDSIPHDTLYPDTVGRDSTAADSTFSNTLGRKNQTALSGALARLKTVH